MSASETDTEVPRPFGGPDEDVNSAINPSTRPSVRLTPNRNSHPSLDLCSIVRLKLLTNIPLFPPV